jgi:hypothetical protein
MAVATSSGSRQYLCRAPLDNEPGSERGNIKNNRHYVHIDSTLSHSYRHSLARRSCGLEIKVAPAWLKIFGTGSSLLAEP